MHNFNLYLLVSLYLFCFLFLVFLLCSCFIIVVSVLSATEIVCAWARERARERGGIITYIAYYLWGKPWQVRRMFYNYYFSLSFLCLAHFLLLCSALLVHLPRLPPLSLSLSFSYLSFRCLFCAKVYTSFDFRSGFERAKNLSVFFIHLSIFAFCLCFLLLLFLFHCFRAYSVCSVGTLASTWSLSRQFAASLKRLHLSASIASSGICPFLEFRLLRRSFVLFALFHLFGLYLPLFLPLSVFYFAIH